MSNGMDRTGLAFMWFVLAVAVVGIVVGVAGMAGYFRDEPTATEKCAAEWAESVIRASRAGDPSLEIECPAR